MMTPDWSSIHTAHEGQRLCCGLKFGVVLAVAIWLLVGAFFALIVGKTSMHTRTLTTVRAVDGQGSI